MSGQFAIFILSMCAIFAATQAFDKAAHIAQIIAATGDCRTSVGASENDIQEMMKRQPSSTREGKCLRACMLKHFKVMTPDGKIDKSVVSAHAMNYSNNDPELMKLADGIIKTCAEGDLPSDHCDAAQQVLTCFSTEIDSRGIEYDM